MEAHEKFLEIRRILANQGFDLKQDLLASHEEPQDQQFVIIDNNTEANEEVGYAKLEPNSR